MKKSTFTGTGVALVTPFKKDDSIDFRALANVIEHVIKNGVEYLVALGTTGETPVLSDKEQGEVIKHVMKVNGGRLPLVVGMGGNHTRQQIERIKNTNFDGIAAILTASPYYSKPNQKGIYNHYMAIAGASPVPVIIYNVPSRTGSNISAETTLKLAAECENFAGIKEASGNMVQIMKIAKDKPAGFDLISGDDALTLPMISTGGCGVISVIGNAFPRQFSEMVRLALDNRWDEARSIHYSLLEIIDQLFIEGSPAGVKAALNILNICENQVRLPLTTVSRTTYGRLTELIRSIPI
ncbi:MAG: 4-hydroxy-tetrahydrodipicolinate synthase [Bacteroidales bacterium]